MAERQRPEALDDRVTGLGSTEPLQLLQHEPGREDPLPRLQRIAQALDSRLARGPSRRSASDHRLVSMKKIHSAAVLGLVVVRRIPVEGREQLDDAPLLMASHVLAQRTGATARDGCRSSRPSALPAQTSEISRRATS